MIPVAEHETCVAQRLQLEARFDAFETVTETRLAVSAVCALSMAPSMRQSCFGGWVLAFAYWLAATMGSEA